MLLSCLFDFISIIIDPMLTFQSFIFYTASSIVGRGEAGAYLQQSMSGRRGTPWTGRLSITGQHRHTQDKQVFGLWEEAGVPDENPRMHGEDMQTPCRKAPRRESNPGPSCCKTTVTVLLTAPPCSP
ncbi:hypothetical protein ILYODFUR_034559 [Ilyodon furcidens]|uniref:Uncharacterized protein n=1 Tax=Ilyodon furcidens TaxID=33524 RepID=A0ABV0U1A4_9TELE